MWRKKGKEQVLNIITDKEINGINFKNRDKQKRQQHIKDGQNSNNLRHNKDKRHKLHQTRQISNKD